MVGERFAMEMIKMARNHEWEGGGVPYSTSDSSCFVDPVAEEELLGTTIQMLIEGTVIFLPYIFLMALMIGMIMVAVRCALPRIGIRITVFKGGTSTTIGCMNFGFTKNKPWPVGFDEEPTSPKAHETSMQPRKVRRYHHYSKLLRLRMKVEGKGRKNMGVETRLEK